MSKLKFPVFTLAVLILTACSNPNDIRFGNNPSQDIRKNADVLSKLAPEDLILLSTYLVYADTSQRKGQPNPAAGKTVGEVLNDAKAWKVTQSRAAVDKAQLDEDTK